MERTINEVFNEISIARDYLKATDYIVIKLSEALANGDNLTELKSLYAEQLTKRKEYRESIDILQVELDALNEELKASEEAKNDEAIIEDVVEQPIKEIPTDISEVVEEIPSEEVTEVDTSEQSTNTPNEEVVEVDTTNQPSDNTTNTSESVEETPSEQPIKETPTEVVENLE